MLNSKTKLLCHRGHHQSVSENTLESFERAVSLDGVDGIETDVRLSADGLPVLFHDRLVDGRPVSSLTRAQLQHLAGYAVPTLDEALQRWDHMFWNVEIKAKEAVERTLRILEKHLHKDRILITSFMHDVVAECAEVTAFDCGWLICHKPRDANALLQGWKAYPNVTVISWYFPWTDPALLDAVAGQGYRNFLWGMQTQTDHDQCAQLNAEGIITDHPERGVMAWGSR